MHCCSFGHNSTAAHTSIGASIDTQAGSTAQHEFVFTQGQVFTSWHIPDLELVSLSHTQWCLHTECPDMQAALQGSNFYESYTGVDLPLAKLDMMGIPGKGGAVENWGLIQFDERRMLVNEVCL